MSFKWSFQGQFLTRKAARSTRLCCMSKVLLHNTVWVGFYYQSVEGTSEIMWICETMTNWLFNPENKMLCSSLFRNARVVSFPSPLAEILIYYDSNENFHCASEDEESLNKQCVNCGVCPPWGKRGLSAVLTATVEMEWAFQNSSSELLGNEPSIFVLGV